MSAKPCSHHLRLRASEIREQNVALVLLVTSRRIKLTLGRRKSNFSEGYAFNFVSAQSITSVFPALSISRRRSAVRRIEAWSAVCRLRRRPQQELCQERAVTPGVLLVAAFRPSPLEAWYSAPATWGWHFPSQASLTARSRPARVKRGKTESAIKRSCLVLQATL